MARIVTVEALDEAARRHLESLTGEPVRALGPHRKEWTLPDDLLTGAEALLCKLPPDNLDAASGLRLIQLTSVGYEHLRDRKLGERSVRVCNARGVYDSAIAEWCLAMMINLVRDLPGMFRNQQAARWERALRFQQEVRGRVLGLWGYGGIGRETARLARAFGLTVHVLTRSAVGPRTDAYALPGTGDPDGVLPDRAFVSGQERDFLGGLDFLVLALPLTRHSEGMVGEEQLRALPRTAFLLNPSRGPIVQEAALLRALAEGWIAGAALDTHFAYPLPPEHPLWRAPNVLLTPHISGADRSTCFPARIADLFGQNVVRRRAGRPLFNEITPREWAEA
jgi:phosphoglycerate dehydrogenase-like enzyme